MPDMKAIQLTASQPCPNKDNHPDLGYSSAVEQTMIPFAHDWIDTNVSEHGTEGCDLLIILMTCPICNIIASVDTDVSRSRR